MNINFENLAEAIIEGKTILILGEGITYNYKNPDNEENAFQELIQKYQDNLSLHQKDGLILLRGEGITRGDLGRALKKFYKQDFSNALLEKIALIPFHLIINITADTTIKKIFEKKELDFQHSYYKLNEKETLAEPNKNKPLIYNLFGCVEGGSDYIFIAHNDLFNYIKSIYNPTSQPPDILKIYFDKKKTDNIIFLGCDLDKWYFQLILYLLNIQQIDRKLHLFNGNSNNNWKEVYEQGFNLSFINKNLDDFVNELYAQFPANELRQSDKQENKASYIEELKTKLNNWLEEGSYDQIFQRIFSDENLKYDKMILRDLQKEMSFTITLKLIQRLAVFITTLSYD